MNEEACSEIRFSVILRKHCVFVHCLAEPTLGSLYENVFFKILHNDVTAPLTLLSYPHVKLWILHHIHHWNFVLAADMHGLSFIYLFISVCKTWKINFIRGLTMDFPCWIQADTIFQFFRRKLKLLCQFEQRNELLAKFTSAMCFVFCPECFSSCCSLPCSPFSSLIVAYCLNRLGVSYSRYVCTLLNFSKYTANQQRIYVWKFSMKLLKLARVDVVGAMFCELWTRLLPLSNGVGCAGVENMLKFKLRKFTTCKLTKYHHRVECALTGKSCSMATGNWQLATSKTTTLTTRVDDDIIQILHNLLNGYNEHEA